LRRVVAKGMLAMGQRRATRAVPVTLQLVLVATTTHPTTTRINHHRRHRPIIRRSRTSLPPKASRRRRTRHGMTAWASSELQATARRR